MYQMRLKIPRRYEPYLTRLRTIIEQENHRGSIIEYGVDSRETAQWSPSLEQIFFTVASVKYAIDIYTDIRSWYGNCKKEDPSLEPPAILYKKKRISLEQDSDSFHAVIEESEMRNPG